MLTQLYLTSDLRRWRLPGSLKLVQRRALRAAEVAWNAARESRRDLAYCGTAVRRGVNAGRTCRAPAGTGTVHMGAGPCAWHGGNHAYGRALGAWLMAHAFAAELNITPWEALLKAVRIAAGKVAYCEWVLASATSDLEIEGRFLREGADESGRGGILVHPDTGEPLGVGELRDLTFWRKQSELWHDRMTKAAKMAIDAGVAKWQIEKAETEAAAIARVLNDVVEQLGDVVDEGVMLRVRKIMRESLLALEAEHVRALDGRPGPDDPAVDTTYSDAERDQL